MRKKTGRSLRRLIVALHSAAVTFGLLLAIVPQDAKATQGYPMECRGGQWLSARQEGLWVYLEFQKGDDPVASGLAPGECSWHDRGMQPGEPPMLRFRAQDRSDITEFRKLAARPEERLRFLIDGNEGVYLTASLESPRLPKRVTVRLDDILKWVPQNVGSDREFAGNGPRVEALVKLSEKNGTLQACVRMKAVETNNGDTWVYEDQCFQVYSGPYRVLEIPDDVDTYSSKSYTDSDEEEDVFTLADSELVHMFVFVGDTHGDDAGLRTSVAIKFNPVDVLVEP